MDSTGPLVRLNTSGLYSFLSIHINVNMELINECRIMFGVKLPPESIAERTKNSSVTY
jgi:hypothetical protein